jgi:hypothetical protein
VLEGDLAAPEGDLEAPEGDLEAPEADLEAPEADLEAPEGDLEAPEGDLEAPEGDLEAPEADLAAPEDNLDVPESDLEAPDGDLEAPEGDLQAPEGNLERLPKRIRITGRLRACDPASASWRSPLPGASAMRRRKLFLAVAIGRQPPSLPANALSISRAQRVPIFDRMHPSKFTFARRKSTRHCVE